MKIKLKPVYFFIFSLLAFIILYISSFFDGFELSLQDATYQSKNPVDSRIVIIGIDDQSLEKLGRWQDWSRKYYADLINKLSAGKPAAIGLDIMFSESSSKKTDDMLLADAIKKAGNVVLPEQGTFPKTRSSYHLINALTVEDPIKELKAAAASVGHINVISDENDGVLRKYLTTFLYKGKKVNSFDKEIYDLFLKNTGKLAPKAGVRCNAEGLTNVQYIGGPGRFEEQPFYSVLNGDIPADYFQGSIVLIGPYAVGVGKDQYITSIDHTTPMYGIEYHANVIQNIIENKFTTNVPDWLNILLMIFIGTVAFLFFRKLSPIKSALVLFAILFSYYLISLYIYIKGYIISRFYPALLVIVIYAIIIGFRYIQELLERKRITGVFGRYVAPQVVKEILKGGEESLKLGGTRREITALFVDIRGFTPMSEKCQPEEVVGILNDYLNLCAESIFKFEGTLDKFIGDATMAIYNAPLDLEDHAFKAVQTAWAMKKGSEVLKTELEKKFGRSVQFGIGVNTGYAVVGNIGSKSRMDYTAIGDTVNTAARLESNAKPGQIILSHETYDRVKDRVIAEPLGEIKVKGKEQGISVYQLNGMK